MANPTGHELREAIGLVAERVGYGKLYDRLVRLNAFVSRRKPPTPEMLADRVYALTGGLRRQVPATLAFHTVWSETFSSAIGEDNDKKLEALADRINAALTEDERAVRDGQAAELAAAIGEYEQILAAAIGPQAARIDMLLKAVQPVAELLRTRPLAHAGAPAASTSPSAAAGHDSD
ncbi:MAG: hypothetical protein ACREQL_10740 [Candidatus Binatia bacterium]